MSFARISVIGLGYIGLPTAAMFASRHKKVFGMDINEQTVATINRGAIHIVEPELDELVHAAVKDGYLTASTEVQPADAFMISVPTPLKGDHNEPDLSYIKSAILNVAPVLQAGNLIVLESTSPVGTTEQMAQWLAAARPDLVMPSAGSAAGDVFIAYCPERVLPGQVVRELVENDRIIGGINPRSSEKAVELYQSFVTGECLVTNARTAEMAKLTENASRDVQIAFANELSMICDELSINVWELIELANKHPRVNILQPGPGVGGHCIAVDPWFIVSKTPDKAKLIRMARQVNDAKPQWVIDQVNGQVARFVAEQQVAKPEFRKQDVTVACFGLTFKPNIDDLRESPALNITQALAAQQAYNVVAVEPNVKADKVGNLTLVSLEQGLTADVLVLLVDHTAFRQFKPVGDYIVDTKGIW